MTPLRLEVRTSEAAMFDRVVEKVVAPLTDGWLGILPGHADLYARLMPGELVVQYDDAEHRLATLGGVLAVEGGQVVVLTGVARLDCSLVHLEQEIGEEARQLAAMETEAARQFDRIYRNVARTSGRRRRGHK